MSDERCACPGCPKRRFDDGASYCSYCEDAGMHLHCAGCGWTKQWPNLDDPGACEQCGGALARWSTIT